jgi:hypothetical protein
MNYGLVREELLRIIERAERGLEIELAWKALLTVRRFEREGQAEDQRITSGSVLGGAIGAGAAVDIPMRGFGVAVDNKGHKPA